MTIGALIPVKEALEVIRSTAQVYTIPSEQEVNGLIRLDSFLTQAGACSMDRMMRSRSQGRLFEILEMTSRDPYTQQ